MGEQRKRGFAAMSPEKQRAIARKGGQVAHGKGTAHEFSPEEARRAGQLGGKAVSANREHMAAIGRKGGNSVHGTSSRRGRKKSAAPPMWVENSLARPQISSVTQRLSNDHQRVNGLFHQYETAVPTPEQKRGILRQIRQELLHHMELEEDKVYPLIRENVIECEQSIATSVQAHEHIKELIRRLADQSLAPDDLTPLMQELQSCVRHHVQEEEQNVFPHAEARLGPELQQLGHELRLSSPENEPEQQVDQHDPGPV